jgi:mono/diheme cytochrome c family protein
MRRPLLALVVVLAAVGAFTGGLAWLLDTPKPPAGAPNAERLYLGLCATCHGPDGRGSWRAALFLVRPGNLSDTATLDRRSDQYLFDLIKHGGAPIGRPGMPAFGSTLTDGEIAELVAYVRTLSRAR